MEKHPRFGVSIPSTPTTAGRTIFAGSTPPTSPAPDASGPGFTIPSPASPPPGRREKPNPFVYTTPLSSAGYYEYAKLAVNSVTLFPIRLALLIVSVLLMYIVASLSLLGWNPDVPTPLPRWRVWLQLPLPYLARLALFAFGYVWITERGAPAPREDAPIVVGASHTGLMEGLYMLWKISPSVVSVADNRAAPVVGSLLSAVQALWVDRSDPHSRHAVLDQIGERANSPGDWPQTLIFPEGLCTARTALITFKKGAFVPGVPVQPVALSWPYQHFSVATLSAGPSVPMVCWRAMCQFVNYMDVTWMQVWAPTHEERLYPMRWARKVRASIAQTLDLPVSDHTYEDLKLLLEARRSALPDDAALLEFGALQSLHEVSFTEAADLLHKFIEMDPDQSGTVDVNRFAAALGTPLTDHVRHLFAVLDRRQTGHLSYRDFCIGLLFLSDAVSNTQVLRFAFDILDANRDGSIQWPEFKTIVTTGFPELAPSQIKAMFDNAADGRESVDFDHFHTYVSSHPEYLYMFMDVVQKPNSPIG